MGRYLELFCRRHKLQRRPITPGGGEMGRIPFAFRVGNWRLALRTQ